MREFWWSAIALAIPVGAALAAELPAPAPIEPVLPAHSRSLHIPPSVDRMDNLFPAPWRSWKSRSLHYEYDKSGSMNYEYNKSEPFYTGPFYLGTPSSGYLTGYPPGGTHVKPPADPASAPPRSSEDPLSNALLFKNFLDAVPGERLVCRAILTAYDEPSPNFACVGPMMNKRKTVSYQITINDGVSHFYEVELFGKSTELALKHDGWVERHRLYVSFGFDGQLQPYIMVSDFEAMFRTTPELSPVHDEIFEYIERKYDSLLRAFQDQFKGIIASAVSDEYGVLLKKSSYSIDK
jgi:hypothetical protein